MTLDGSKHRYNTQNRIGNYSRARTSYMGHSVLVLFTPSHTIGSWHRYISVIMATSCIYAQINFSRETERDQLPVAIVVNLVTICVKTCGTDRLNK